MTEPFKLDLNDNGSLDKMRKSAAKVGDLSVPHKRIAAFLDQWVRENFDGDGALLEDGAWDPFVHGGRVTEDGIDTSAKLLRDMGVLYAHFNMIADKRQAGIGNDIPYSQDHEEGEGWTPQRRMLPRQGEVIEDITRIYEEYIAEVTQ